MNETVKNRIIELTLKSIDGRITAEEFAELDSYLAASTDHAQWFTGCTATFMALTDHYEETAGGKNGGLDNASFDPDLWRKLSEEEKAAPMLEVPHARLPQELVPDVRQRMQMLRREQSRAVNRPLLFIALSSLAALLLVIAYIVLNPPAVNEVATVIDTIDAKWAPENNLGSGSRLVADSVPVYLHSGAVKLVSDKNVELVLEGPARFQFDSVSQMKLFQGKLYAKVSPRGQGFSVDTVNMKIIDLGTEFGIAVDANGDSLVQMHKGKASLVSGVKKGSLNNRILTEGQAGTVSSAAGVFKPSSFNQHAFLQEFNSEKRFRWHGENQISLADIVGGGNGFGNGILNRGINPVKGTSEMFTESALSRKSGRSYTKAKGNPLVDGVFVLGDSSGPLKISSQGHAFSDCPVSNGSFWGGIINGARHGTLDKTIPFHNLRLDDQTYGVPGTSCLYIHASQGITFDLQAIRLLMPERKFNAFTAQCGISDTLYDYAAALRAWLDNRWLIIGPEDTNADFYVLVDGQVRFSAREVSVSDKAIPIHVPLRNEDRFLTLMTGQGTDPYANTDDWTLFADPALVIEDQ